MTDEIPKALPNLRQHIKRDPVVWLACLISLGIMAVAVVLIVRLAEAI